MPFPFCAAQALALELSELELELELEIEDDEDENDDCAHIQAAINGSGFGFKLSLFYERRRLAGQRVLHIDRFGSHHDIHVRVRLTRTVC